MKYSFVVPIFNDGALAEDFCAQMQTVFKKRLGTEHVESDLEVIFVDDGSRNDSVERLKKTCEEFAFAKLVALTRNFGQHVALSCGYQYSKGDFVGMLNVDQEDPPDQLPILLDAIETGEWDIVGGLYERRDAPFFTRLTSFLFHKTLNRLTGYELPVNASNARVMSRRFVTSYNSLTERSRYIPGLEMWLGYKYGRVAVRHQRRRTGTSSYNFRRRLRMGIESIVSFSDYPLRLAVKFGFGVAFLGILIILGNAIDKMFFRAFLPGYLTTLAAIVFFGGMQIFVTGVASLYIGRILAEVQGRPLFLVRETRRIDDATLTRGGA